MVEGDNLIGTVSEIEKHCETSQGIKSKYMLTNDPKMHLKYCYLIFPFSSNIWCLRNQE